MAPFTTLLRQKLTHLVKPGRCLLLGIDGRLTASQIAAASAGSFLFRRTLALA